MSLFQGVLNQHQDSFPNSAGADAPCGTVGRNTGTSSSFVVIKKSPILVLKADRSYLKFVESEMIIFTSKLRQLYSPILNMYVSLGFVPTSAGMSFSSPSALHRSGTDNA